MLNSHGVRHKISFAIHFITIHHENFTDTLDNFDHSGVISNSVCGSKLPVSTIKNAGKLIFDMLNLFSDYDLRLICSSKCEDAYVECVTTCSSSDCLIECKLHLSVNYRAAVTCGDGKYLAYCISIGP